MKIFDDKLAKNQISLIKWNESKLVHERTSFDGKRKRGKFNWDTLIFLFSPDTFISHEFPSLNLRSWLLHIIMFSQIQIHFSRLHITKKVKFLINFYCPPFFHELHKTLQAAYVADVHFTQLFSPEAQHSSVFTFSFFLFAIHQLKSRILCQKRRQSCGKIIFNLKEIWKIILSRTDFKVHFYHNFVSFVCNFQVLGFQVKRRKIFFNKTEF